MTLQDQDLDADAQLLLAELRLGEQPDGGALGRVRERVAVSLTATLVGTGNNVAHPPATACGPSKWGRGASVSKLALVVAFTLGTTVGAVGYGWVRPPATVYRDRVVLPATKTPPAVVSTPPTPVIAVASSDTARPSVSVEAAARTSAPTGGGKPTPVTAPEGLSGELQLIDKARAALGAGDATAALAALPSHLVRYPHGTFEQERAALRVKALVGSGRNDDARAATVYLRSIQQ